MDTKNTETRIKELEQRVSKLEKQIGIHPMPRPGTKKQSAKEFLMSKTASSDPQKVLALAYFLERVEGMPSYNVMDLENVFRAAKEKLPKNMNDTVNKNIAKGFLMEVEGKKDSKKVWCLTSTGEQFVEHKMNYQ